LSNLFTLLANKTSDVSQNREPKLFKDAQCYVIHGCLLWISIVLVLLIFLFSKKLTIDSVAWSLSAHVLLVSYVKSMTMGFNISIYNLRLFFESSSTYSQKAESLR